MADEGTTLTAGTATTATTATNGANGAPAYELPEGVTAAQVFRESGAAWHDLLPDELEVKDAKGAVTGKVALKGDKTLARYATLPDAARALIDQHKALSERATAGLKVPDATSTPEARQAWRDAIGVPKTPSDYEITAEGFDPKMVEGFRVFTHTEGLPASTATKLTNWYAEAQRASLDAAQQGWVKELDETRRAWGQPLYERRVTAAGRFIDEMSTEAGLEPKAVRAWLDETRLGDHPILFKILALAGERMIEDHVIDGDTSSKGDATDRIQAIRSDPKHPLNPANHGGDADKRRQWDELYKMAYGTREDTAGFR